MLKFAVNGKLHPPTGILYRILLLIFDGDFAALSRVFCLPQENIRNKIIEVFRKASFQNVKNFVSVLSRLYLFIE